MLYNDMQVTHTEAEYRSPTIDRKRAQVIYACIWMFFEDFSGLRALTEAEVVPYGRILDNVLLRYVLAQWDSQRERRTRS